MKKIRLINESSDLYSFEKDGKTLYFVKPNAGEKNIQVWDNLEDAQTKSKPPKLIKVKDFLKDVISIDEWVSDSDPNANIFNSIIDSMKIKDDNSISLDQDKEDKYKIEDDVEVDDKEDQEEKDDNKESKNNQKNTDNTDDTNTNSTSANTSGNVNNEIKVESEIRHLIKGLILDINNDRISDANIKTKKIIEKKIDIYTREIINKI